MENDIQKIDRPCPACGGGDFQFFAKKNSHDLFRCRECGVLFVHPIPKNLSDIYVEDYFAGAKKGSGYVDYDRDKLAMTETFETYLDEIARLRPKHGRLLDVGAATGTFVEAANRRGWDSSGIEISDYAAQKGREKGLDIRTGVLENSGFKEETFDAITMWDVVEHLPDPSHTVTSACALLKPNGVLALNTPNAGSLFARMLGTHWHLIVPPEHLVYFNTANLSELLVGAGFEIEKTACLGKKFTLQYIFKTLAEWQKFFLWRWIAEKLHGRAIGRIALSINLHDNLFLIAKKQESIKEREH